jgi:hypothetical protein
LKKARPELIGLSNSFFARDAAEGSRRADMNLERVHKIEEALDLPTGL